MGLFNTIRKQFDRGGVGLKLELPKNFMWSDGQIPASVTITGHATEPRRINGLRFNVIDDEKEVGENDSTPRTRSVDFNFDWDQEGPIELAAGEVKELEIDIPLPAKKTAEEMSEEAFGRPASGFLEKAFVAATTRTPTDRIDRFLVTVIAPVEGASKAKRARKHILQGKSFAGGTVTVIR